MMKNKLQLMALMFLVSFYDAFSGVRTIHTNENHMKKIYLTLGRSTVLHFTSAPKKAIVGNQNYFNIEFVKGTNDVTIQPLSKFNTNLFIYTEDHSFGLLLRVNQGKRHDDRVNVKWSSVVRVKIKTPKKKILKKDIVNKVKLSIKDQLKFKSLKIFPFGVNGLYLFDLEVENLSIQEVKTKDIKFSLTRSEKDFSNQKIVFDKEILKPNEKTKVRIYLKLKGKRGFTLKVNFKNQKDKAIVSRRYL